MIWHSLSLKKILQLKTRLVYQIERYANKATMYFKYAFINHHNRLIMIFWNLLLIDWLFNLIGDIRIPVFLILKYVHLLTCRPCKNKCFKKSFSCLIIITVSYRGDSKFVEIFWVTLMMVNLNPVAHNFNNNTSKKNIIISYCDHLFSLILDESCYQLRQKTQKLWERQIKTLYLKKHLEI